MSAFDSAISVPTVSTGTNLIVGSQKLNENTATPMSPMDSLRAVFDDMRDTLESIKENTFQTVELLKTSVVGKSQQDRDQDIKEGETDVPPTEEKGPGMFARLGDTLSGLNPFKDGAGPFTKFLLAGAALIGLRMFGEKFNEPLANLVKAFKEGTIVDNLKKTVEKIQKSLEPIIQKIRDSAEKFVIGATKVKNLIVDAYNFVNDYIMQFDKDGDGKLDETERGALAKDLKDKAITLIGDFFGEVMLSLSGLILSVTFVNLAAKTAYARLLPLFTSTATTGAAAAVGGPMAGLATALPIAGLILYGFSTTYTNISRALKKTLDENKGQFDTSDFFANFLGGSEGGGVMNAFKQAFLVGGSFALAGMAIGIVGGPLGILAGGLIGTAIGLAVGAFTGYIGSGVLKEKFQGFADMIGDSVDTIKNFYNDIIAGFKSLFSGNSFMEGFDARGDADVEGLTKKVEAAENYVKEIEKFQAENPKYATLPGNVELLANAKADLEELRQKLDKAPAKSKQYKLDNIQDEIDSKTKKMNKLQAKVDDGNLMPGIDSVSQGVPFETQIKQLDAEIKSLETVKNAVNNTQSLEELLAAINEPASFKNSTMIMDEYMANRYKQLGARIVPNEKGGGFMFAPNHAKVNSENVNKQENHSYTGGLSSGDNFMTAVIMANKKAQTN
jgi:hypothetical protein